MKLTSLEEVYFGHLRDLASTERQLTQALGDLAEAATNDRLKEGFEKHKGETEQHFEKLEGLLKEEGKSARGRRCKATEGLILDGVRAVKATGDNGVKDAALAMVGKQTERFEIAAYQAAISMAVALERYEDAHLLKEILSQEYAADSTLGGFLETDCGVPAAPEAISEATPRSELEGEALIESSTKNARSTAMPRDYDDRYDNRGNGYENRGSRGGQHSAAVQERDEYGQFAGRGGRGYDREYDDNGGGRRSSSGGGRGGYDRDYDDDRGYGRGGGYEGRARGGRHSAEMQGRDEYGQFTGSQGGGGGQYAQGGRGGYDRDYDDDRGGYGRGGNFGGYEGRARGGRHSAEMQGRDEYGQFTGSQGGGGYRGDYGRDYNDYNGGQRNYGGGGGHYGEYGGRGRGGYSPAEMQGRDEHGRYTGYQGGPRGGRYDRDYDDRGGSRGGYGRGGGNYGGGGDITDSAGRHYTRESWERAQDGRSLGGQHSHGGGRGYNG